MEKPSRRIGSVLVAGVIPRSTSLQTAPGRMVPVLEEWKQFFGSQAADPQATSARMQTLSTKLEAVLNDPGQHGKKLELIAAASDEPLVGLGLVLAALPTTAKARARQWWDLFLQRNRPAASPFTSGSWTT